MTVTTNERGQNNMFAKEPKMYTQEVTVTHNEKAEMLNGRLAMLGCDRCYRRLRYNRTTDPWHLLNSLSLWPTLAVAVVVLWFISGDNDDDDEPGGGLMQPAYERN